MPEVEQALNKVDDRSLSRPLALHFIGFAHWQQYRTEKQKPEDKRDEKLMAAEQAAAEVALSESMKRQRAAADKDKDPLPAQLFDTQLLLSELLLDAGKNQEAADLLKPLVAKIAVTSEMDEVRDQNADMP